MFLSPEYILQESQGSEVLHLQFHLARWRFRRALGLSRQQDGLYAELQCLAIEIHPGRYFDSQHGHYIYLYVPHLPGNNSVVLRRLAGVK